MCVYKLQLVILKIVAEIKHSDLRLDATFVRIVDT